MKSHTHTHSSHICKNRTNVKSLTIYYLLLLNGTNRDSKIYLFICIHNTHTHRERTNV